MCCKVKETAAKIKCRKGAKFWQNKNKKHMKLKVADYSFRGER